MSLLAPDILFPSASKTLLMVVGSHTTGTPDDADDANMKTFLEGEGWTVTVIADETVAPADLANYDVTLCTDTIQNSVIDDTIYDEAYPLVHYKYGSQVELDFTSSGETRTNTSTTLDNRSTTHPITTGFSLGTTTLNSSGDRMGETVTANLGSGVTDLMGKDSSSESSLYVYASGAQMDTNTAPARRVYLYHNATTPSNMATDGETITARAFEWAAGNI